VKHTIAHFDIPAADVARAKAFYGGLFGWEFSPAEGFPDY
jgi:predicted enzyme related to lactoylglutathione lyase